MITSSNRLRVETGRWERPLMPFYERKCILYDTNYIEDESHYTLICPLYNDIKRSNVIEMFFYLPPIFKVYASVYGH